MIKVQPPSAKVLIAAETTCLRDEMSVFYRSVFAAAVFVAGGVAGGTALAADAVAAVDCQCPGRIGCADRISGRGHDMADVEEAGACDPDSPLRRAAFRTLMAGVTGSNPVGPVIAEPAAMAAEVTLAVCIPCAIRPRNAVPRASSSLTCTALLRQTLR